MVTQTTVMSEVPGCTLQVTHDDSSKSQHPYSVSLYARAVSSKKATIAQLVYAPADVLLIAEMPDGRFVLHTRLRGEITTSFEITLDAALTIADFAGISILTREAA